MSDLGQLYESLPTKQGVQIPHAVFSKFMSRVARVPGGCWNWTASCATPGYGQFWYRGRLQAAHRFSYEMFSGRSPSGFDVLHSCDNRKCVNPEHLSTGDATENMRQASQRGRIGSKLPNAVAKDIVDSSLSYGCLAKIHGVSKTTVWRLKKFPRVWTENESA